MIDYSLWISGGTLVCLALALSLYLLHPIWLSPRVRARLRHRHYRLTTRGWAARRLRLRMEKAAEKFRNHQARFISCMHHPHL